MNKICNIKALQLSDRDIEVVVGTTISEVLELYKVEKHKYIGVKINNKYKNFDTIIHKDSNVEFFEVNDFEGERIYRRTVSMILNMAISKILPNSKLIVRYSIPGGFNFALENCDDLIDYSDDILTIMNSIVAADMPITNVYYHNSEAQRLFEEGGHTDKVNLMKYNRRLYYNLVQCGDTIGYYYGVLAHSTAYVKHFEVVKFRNSYLLFHPHTNINNFKADFDQSIRLYDTVYYYKKHLVQLGVNDVVSVNANIASGNIDDMIKVAEAQQSKQFVEVASNFQEKYNAGAKIILVSGPSSSGKTTFSYKLRVMLKTYGIVTHILSMDNYFINREDIPIDENGERDFERFENVDLELFNTHLKALMDGETIEVPKYDFSVGQRVFGGKQLKLEENGIVLIEGIHALNPKLTADVKPRELYKIFLSPLASVSLDDDTYFSIDDNRLIRRIIRDDKFRADSAASTINRWASVRNGERKYIFPYQDQANYYFNTSLFYELNVLKPSLLMALMEVSSADKAYAEAHRLITLISSFLPIDTTYVPSDSLIREFIGGSSFDY